MSHKDVGTQSIYYLKSRTATWWTILFVVTTIQAQVSDPTNSWGHENILQTKYLDHLFDQNPYCERMETMCESDTQIYCCGTTLSLTCCHDSLACCPHFTTCCGIYCCERGDVCNSDGCYKYERKTDIIPIGFIGMIFAAICGGICKLAKKPEEEGNRREGEALERSLGGEEA